MAEHWQFADRFRVSPGSSVVLEDLDPGWTPEGLTKSSAKTVLSDAKKELFALQERFAAESGRGLLVILQAMDAAGKDSLIEHVLTGMNPQGVNVISFKAPTTLERSHDYLWRHQTELPKFGRITVFNRSHYENVLITRVHPEIIWPVPTPSPDEEFWAARFSAINAWERHLADNGTTIVKFFLHLSRDEQRRRFLSRMKNPTKAWKYSAADLHEREFWDQYQHAYADMLGRTSTESAPWHVLPADHKWFTRLGAVSVLLRTLTEIDPQFPTMPEEDRADVAVARAELEAEGGDATKESESE